MRFYPIRNNYFPSISHIHVNTIRYPLYQSISLYYYHVQSQDCNSTIKYRYKKWKLNSKTIYRCALYMYRLKVSNGANSSFLIHGMNGNI